MNTTELLQMINKNLSVKKTAIAEKMIDGGASDYQSYIKDVGIAQGLEDACAIIDETIKQIDREDD